MRTERITDWPAGITLEGVTVMEPGLVDIDPDEHAYGGEEKARVPCVAAF
jgi:hypothetical protein